MRNETEIDLIPDEPASDVLAPLADRLRPREIDEVIGQGHLLARGGPIDSIRDTGRLYSLVLWGPPGVGKTTLARLLAGLADAEFIQVSAAHTNIAELKKIFSRAEELWSTGKGTVLFVDEIHCFNRTRQDSFLRYLENGSVILIGATTENPSFELNSALLSRARVLVMNRLEPGDLEHLIARAETYMGNKLPVTSPCRERIIELANGDGRSLLNMVEQVFTLNEADSLEPDDLAVLLARRAAGYDKSGDWHYNLISALHKSVRGSDPDAALYWFARMLDGGEDPRFIARRVVRMAVEDIGLADPEALAISLHSWETYERLGSPEGELALAQAVIYLALSPKSNSAYKAYGMATKMAASSGSLFPPKHILNSPTSLMRDLGYSRGYVYDHDTEQGVSGQRYFPAELGQQEFYHPVERGFEREMVKRLAYFKRLRNRAADNDRSGKE